MSYNIYAYYNYNSIYVIKSVNICAINKHNRLSILYVYWVYFCTFILSIYFICSDEPNLQLFILQVSI